MSLASSPPRPRRSPTFATSFGCRGAEVVRSVHALSLNMAVGRNEIVGLIGYNGAGKSTLIKTLTGVYKPTSGRIFVRYRELDLSDYSVGTAHEPSIETVYQDKSLGEKQPLWRNFFVGRQIVNRFGFINVKKKSRSRGKYF